MPPGSTPWAKTGVQEMTAKLAENAYAGRPLHFIGHLQRNKVRQVVGKADLIQSVGSTELLQEIEKAAGRLELCQDILLEVNIGGEAAKSGFAPEDIAAAAETALAMPHVRVRGLMTIPPWPWSPTEIWHISRKCGGFMLTSMQKYTIIRWNICQWA